MMNRGFFRQVMITRKKTVLSFFGLILLNVMLFVFSTAYQEPRLAKLHQQVAEKRQVLQSGVTQDSAAIYREGKADLATWRKRIPPKKDFARFVGDLFETASNNSVKMSGVTYKPDIVKEEGLISFSISLNVTGKYSGIKSFLADLGRSRDILYIDTISLNNTKPTEEAIGMRVQLTAFFRPEAQ